MDKSAANVSALRDRYRASLESLNRARTRAEALRLRLIEAERQHTHDYQPTDDTNGFSHRIYQCACGRREWF